MSDQTLTVAGIVRRSVGRQLAEHEVFLSFPNDADAAAFQDWLAETGLSAFMEWYERLPAAGEESEPTPCECGNPNCRINAEEAR